tara:strand:- start:395 stop:571 length:177 start_codon:yes stop_codon:yes gene_type:complete
VHGGQRVAVSVWRSAHGGQRMAVSAGRSAQGGQRMAVVHGDHAWWSRMVVGRHMVVSE